jgi:hypothetical protein
MPGVKKNITRKVTKKRKPATLDIKKMDAVENTFFPEKLARVNAALSRAVLLPS